jgi:uncharacterized membrane protein
MNLPTQVRQHLPLTPRYERHFRWRGREVSRLEGFTDAVFAFAVTLLIVALEVPHTYEGLMDVVRGFPAFVVCFALLMTFWSAHYRYFRRYGLEDVFTRLMTMAILVLVLFSVYPVKFLFSLVSGGFLGIEVHNVPHVSTPEQMTTLFTVYGLGFAGAWGLYGALYVHVLRQRDVLGLTAAEIIQTRASLWEYAINVAVCVLSIALAHLPTWEMLPGLIYMLLAPLQWFNGWWHGRKLRTVTAAAPAEITPPERHDIASSVD